MATGLSKRHQARNEKALQELIKSIPGNDRCADCSARNPGWASWSLGIFLCMRCGAIHRKLGTHISKVKSLSMDSWSTDQVENMRKIGNAASNKIFNPHNVKPRVPADLDEVDGVMERFIRAKYEQRTYAEGAAPSRATTVQAPSSGSRDSEDQPPTPPPKPGKRFGFGLRSSASALNLSRTKEKDTSRKSSTTGKMFGATIGVTDDGMQWKLVTLREMGFPDEQRNTSVLKGMNGDLQRTIDSLVRLGEGVPGAQTKSPHSSQFPGHVNTPPVSESKSRGSAPAASLQKPTPPLPMNATGPSQPSHAASSPSSPRSYNPFENIQPVATQQRPHPAQPQPQMSLDSAMQNLSIGQIPPYQYQYQQQQPQSLFPNTTGGYPNTHDQQQMRFQQSLTPPPVPNIPGQFNSYNNPYAQQQSYNPFLNNIQQQTPQPASNPFLNQQAQFGATNPFFSQHNNSLSAALSQPETAIHQVQQQVYQQSQSQQAVPQLWMNQPIQNSPGQFAQTQYFPNVNQQPFANNHQLSSTGYPDTFQQQPQQLQSQNTGRFDKDSILALYNYPHLAPQKLAQTPESISEEGPVYANSSEQREVTNLPEDGIQAKRSSTLPASGSRNPFARSGITNMVSPTGSLHGAQESVDSGRHSPDAFASLSARFVR